MYVSHKYLYHEDTLPSFLIFCLFFLQNKRPKLASDFTAAYLQLPSECRYEYFLQYKNQHDGEYFCG